MRARLAQPTFNRWHAAYQMLPNAPSADAQFLAREAFLDSLSACHANETCARNFALGNRKTRLCRACPLPPRFTVLGNLDEALDFWAAIGEAISQFKPRECANYFEAADMSRCKVKRL